MKILAFGAFAIASLVASSALAQAQTPTNPGPVLPGVCAYSNNELLITSTAGQSVQAGMQRLATEVQGELQPYDSTIQTELAALRAGADTIPQPELQQRSQALQQRVNEARQLEETRNNELRYTLNQQREAIAVAAQPIILALYQDRGCGVLLDRDQIVYINPAMDLTQVVVQRVNAALPTLNFSRMPVPVEAQ